MKEQQLSEVETVALQAGEAPAGLGPGGPGGMADGADGGADSCAERESADAFALARPHGRTDGNTDARTHGRSLIGTDA